MGAVFALGILAVLVILIVMFIVGILLFGLGLAGNITISIFKKKGKTYKKPLHVLSIISLVGGIFLMIPTTFLTIYGFISYLTPPAEYVETELIIEENGRQYNEFTVNGEKYKKISFILYKKYDLNKKAVFSWKTSGWINSGQVGNYYEFDNNSPYYFVMDDDNTLFCKANEYEEIKEYYSNDDNYNINMIIDVNNSKSEATYIFSEYNDLDTLALRQELLNLFYNMEYEKDNIVCAKTVVDDGFDYSIGFNGVSIDSFVYKYYNTINIMEIENEFYYAYDFYFDESTDKVFLKMAELPDILEQCFKEKL